MEAGANHADQGRVTAAPQAQPVSDEFVHLIAGSRSGIGDSLRLVVRDSAAWQTLWSRITNGTGYPPIPRVDFRRDMVLVVTSGTRPSTRWEISIDSVSVRAGNLLVFVRQVVPDRCIVGGMLTHPFAVVRVPRSDRPIRFVEQHELLSCR